jgi:hypothetical protein
MLAIYRGAVFFRRHAHTLVIPCKTAFAYERRKERAVRQRAASRFDREDSLF